MKLPNMDTARIKRLDNDHFTVDALSTFNGRTICDHCAIPKCKTRNYIKRNNKDEDALLKVQTCNAFLPTLGFSVLAGLDLDLWNTVRVGGAWAKRLTPGKIVAIADTKNKVMRDNMRVETVFTGTLSGMLDLHAENNHAIKDEISTGKIKHHQAPSRLLRILKNAYGTNIAAEDRDASVIYLKKLDS